MNIFFQRFYFSIIYYGTFSGSFVLGAASSSGLFDSFFSSASSFLLAGSAVDAAGISEEGVSSSRVDVTGF